ncbi:hypothetical protein [Trichothermofontia sp.]
MRQLLAANHWQPRDVVIISAAAIERPADFADNPHVHFIHADPTHYAMQKKFRAAQAKAVILLADRGTEDPDAQNALIALAISSSGKAGRQPRPNCRSLPPPYPI